jgi:hypothetical protein
MVIDLKFEASIRREWRRSLSISCVLEDSRLPCLPQFGTKSHYIFI